MGDEAEVAQERICKRPGCGNPVPEVKGRGRSRVFCGDACARQFHNDARPPMTAVASVGEQDPFAALEPLLRQAAVLAKAGREQIEGLEPARVRVEIADAEAARRRAEAAVVTAQARQAEAESEVQALAEALNAAREDKAAAESAATAAEERAALLEAEIGSLHGEDDQRAAATADLRERVATAEAEVSKVRRELDQAQAEARAVRADADAEIARARQAEADAREEIQRIRDDAAREREALQAACDAQLRAQQALTAAERARAERAEDELQSERAERWQIVTSMAARQNGHASPGIRTAEKTGQRRTAGAAAGGGTE